MVGSFAGCCARAASGQAAAPPNAAINSRRPIVAGMVTLRAEGCLRSIAQCGSARAAGESATRCRDLRQSAMQQPTKWDRLSHADQRRRRATRETTMDRDRRAFLKATSLAAAAAAAGLPAATEAVAQARSASVEMKRAAERPGARHVAPSGQLRAGAA